MCLSIICTRGHQPWLQSCGRSGQHPTGSIHILEPFAQYKIHVKCWVSALNAQLLLFWSKVFCVTSPCNVGTELILACNFCVLFSSEWWLLEYILNNEHLFLTKFSQEPLLMLVVGWQLFNWALEPAEDEILDELFLSGYQDALVWVNQQQTILSPHSNGAATQTGRPPPPLENLSQTSSI